MKQKTLIKTNPHLRDRIQARKLLIRSLASSTAIETGEPIDKIEARLARKHFTRFPVTLA